ncbi:MAG TPA: hypothetical protein VFK17_02310 [Gaiellaceae bacterium]|nr:hypothetical protein [Gaiellaceae bacterium]
MIPPTVDAWLAPPVLPRPLPDQALVLSPELALVDDELRAEAIALLPELRPYEFLELRDPPPDQEWLYVEPLIAYRATPRQPNLAVAAGAYLAAAVLRTLAFNLAVFACIALVVLIVNLTA